MRSIVGHFFWLLLLLSCQPTQKNHSEEPPNIVIIFTDDQGYQDVGCFGASGILTPHLDQMAREGVKLTSFYAAQAVCSASRAALLTGCYPNRIGIHQAFMPNAKIGLKATETTIAEMLKAEGYATGIFGKWHLGDAEPFLPTRHGFDEWYGIPYSNDMWPHHPQQARPPIVDGKNDIGQSAIFNFGPLPLYENETIIDTLEDQSMLTTHITERSVAFIEKNKTQPFFLYVPHPQPHVPLYVSDKFKGKSDRGLYGDVIMEIDWSVGEILLALKKNELEENTVVIFTSDNGPWLAYGNHAGSALPFREGKGTAWEGGQREPFIIKYPGHLKAGSVVDVPAMAIDLLPTIAHLARSSLPELKIDGKNIWPIIAGAQKESVHKAYYFYYKVNELHAIRMGDWKMYFPHNYRTMKGQEPGKDGMPGSYAYVDLAEVELYDLSTDLGEEENVATQHPEIIAQMKSMADEKRRDLGDRLVGVEGEGVR